MPEPEKKRYRVRLEHEHGIAESGPGAYLEEEPSEGDEITLEDGTPALVRYLLTVEVDGSTVIAAKRLPRE